MTETGARKWIITITVIMASLIELIDTSIVNVALPQMMGNLGATLDEVAWVVTAYVVANVIVIPMTGWLSAVFGRRNYFAGSIILFTIASFFCGHATNIWELVVFRFIQGVGGGALLSTSQSILVETFPPEELGLANGLFGLGVVVGPTIGPTLGGWITDNYSWPWIFYVNIPIGIVAALLTLSFIRDAEGAPEDGRGRLGRDRAARRRDRIRCRSCSSAASAKTGSPRPTSSCSRSWLAVGIVAFIWRELTAEHPVVDLRVFRDRSLAVGTLFTFILGFGLYSSVFIFPVFAQNLLGFTAMQTGPDPAARRNGDRDHDADRRQDAAEEGDPGAADERDRVRRRSSSSPICSRNRRSPPAGQNFFWPLIFRGVGLGLPVRAADDARALGPARQGHRSGRGDDEHDAAARRLLRRRARRDLHREALLDAPADAPARTSRSTTPPLRERLDAIVAGIMATGLAARSRRSGRRTARSRAWCSSRRSC